MRFLLLILGIAAPIVVLKGFGLFGAVLLWLLGTPRLPFTATDAADWRGISFVIAVGGFLLLVVYGVVSRSLCRVDTLWRSLLLANPISWAIAFLFVHILDCSELPIEFNASTKWILVLMWPAVLLQAWLGVRTHNRLAATMLAVAYSTLVAGLWAWRASEVFSL
ncbi:MAG: hypothetical protein FJW36_08565 [Acidobacteria bacterium]|nr:hypothetical protein [Acidobacteriota bacterium]